MKEHAIRGNREEQQQQRKSQQNHSHRESLLRRDTASNGSPALLRLISRLVMKPVQIEKPK